MILEFAKYLIAGMSAGFKAFLSALPLYQELNGIKEQIIAAGLHIPVVVVSTIGLLLAVFKYLYKKVG